MRMTRNEWRKQQIGMLKNDFPPGTRVELLRMEDPQAPPIGTLGTVKAVDDIGTIHVAWDNGSSLGLVLGVDDCRKVNY